MKLTYKFIEVLGNYMPQNAVLPPMRDGYLPASRSNILGLRIKML